MSAADVDLGTLVRERGERSTRPPRRRLRILLPLAVLAVFAALFATNLRDWLVGARAVAVVRPLPVLEGGPAAAAGSVATQAAGWVEPDPFLVHVPALAEGVVREMLVEESDVVEAGEPVAYLVDDDARLALTVAEGQLAGAQGELAAAQAEQVAASTALEEAIELTAAREGAAAALDARRAEAELRSQAVVQGRARLELGQEELLVQEELERAGAAGPRQVEIAEARCEEARGLLAGLEAEAALAEAQVRVAEVELKRARRNDELRIEERRRLAAAEASVVRAEGRLAERSAARDEARLRLDRMVVRAPVDGVVLERLAVAGATLFGLTHHVATLYDPSSLRVRVDVPQQDLARLFVGQEARIQSDARPGAPYVGEVLRVVQRADIQKVTLQAHVRVTDGDELLRPEMLVQVQFLAPPPEGRDAPAAAGAAVSVPEELVAGGHAWVLDAERGTATRRRLELGARADGRVIVTEGLDLSDKLLRPNDGAELREGERVEVTEVQR